MAATYATDLNKMTSKFHVACNAATMAYTLLGKDRSMCTRLPRFLELPVLKGCQTFAAYRPKSV